MRKKIARKPTKKEIAQEEKLKESLGREYEQGKAMGIILGQEAAKQQMREREREIQKGEREQQFKALASLGRVADQLSSTAADITRMVLSLNGHL